MNLPSDITVETSKGSKEVSMTDTEMFVSCFSVQTENNQSEEPLWNSRLKDALQVVSNAGKNIRHGLK